jgi:hypothetical protein
MYSYQASLSVGSDFGGSECEETLRISINCLEDGQLTQIFIFTTITLLLTSLYIMLSIYLSDFTLAQRLLEINTFYIPITLLVSSLGLFPSEGCLGWAGCYVTYLFKPLITFFGLIYIGIIHAVILTSVDTKILKKLLVYVICTLLFLLLFWNLFL